MKCDACGAPVENGKCTYCGKVFQEVNPAPDEAVIIKDNPESKQNSKKLTTCKACGAKVGKGAKTCPKCGAKIKKPIYKRWWFWVLILCIIGGIGGGTSNNNDKDMPSTPVVNENVQSETKEQQAAEENVAEEEKIPVTNVESEVESEPIEENTESNGISEELKSFLDSYENFVDEYCAFVSNYDASDLSQLAQYTTLMQKYADFAAKVDAYNQDDMNAAELAYYTEVMGRVSSKLLNVGLSL